MCGLDHHFLHCLQYIRLYHIALPLHVVVVVTYGHGGLLLFKVGKQNKILEFISMFERRGNFSAFSLSALTNVKILFS